MTLNTNAILAEERVAYLEHEHDERVEEYRAMKTLLPNVLERAAMRQAVVALADAGKVVESARLSAYLLRLEASGN